MQETQGTARGKMPSHGGTPVLGLRGLWGGSSLHVGWMQRGTAAEGQEFRRDQRTVRRQSRLSRQGLVCGFVFPPE